MTDPLWTGQAALSALDATAVGPAPQAIGGVSFDSRTLQAGDLFFAIQGVAMDGHDFVRDALAKGAAAAVVARDRASDFAGAGPLMVVPDVLEALRDLARAARAQAGGRIVAVTGSVGKTGTKEALRLALGRQGATHAADASFNNHWGVPLTLARLPRSSAYGVFEIGMNHAGEILPLTAMVRPHVVLITTIEPVHIEFFPSVSAIADAKAETFSGIEPAGVAVLPRDNPHFARLRDHALASRAGRIVSFGEHEAADVRAVRIIAKPDLSIIEARLFGADLVYRVGAPGRHIALNSLGVLAAVQAAGADPALAALALADLQPPAGRGERTLLALPGGPATLIDESYNANPASVRAALATLAQTPVAARNRRIAVLGDMLELGPGGDRVHADLAEAVEAAADRIYLAGPLMKNLWDAVSPTRRGRYADTAEGLHAALAAELLPGDVVMVKGSRGSRMAPLVQMLKQRFGPSAPASPAAAAR